MAITPIAIVAYLSLFMGVGAVFLFVALLLGRFLRPHSPTPQKSETYECGETAVGPSFLQYDLRFYVVALLFIIFEVEVALFFPPAVVFGKINQLRSIIPQTTGERSTESVSAERDAFSSAYQKTLRELGASATSALPAPAPAAVNDRLQTLVLAVMVDLGLFFAVLLVGFAYLWHRGDIAWVRARPEKREAAG